MAPPPTYPQFVTTRTAVAASAWNAITIPPGSIDAMISLEDSTSTFRVTSNNLIALNQGSFVPATGAYVFPGSSVNSFVVYVNPANATTVVLQTQR